MKTRDKILAAALELYNTTGTEQVTSRHIATHIGISDGNLRYHFPRQEQLIFALYEALVRQIDEKLELFIRQPCSLYHLFESQVATMEVFLQYKFLFQDFAGLMRKYPQIHAHFLQLMEGRNTYFQGLIEMMKAAGLLRKELSRETYAHLIHNLGILNNFWINDAGIFHQTLDQHTTRKYAIRIFYTMVPYLTRQGLSEFMTMESSFC